MQCACTSTTFTRLPATRTSLRFACGRRAAPAHAAAPACARNVADSSSLLPRRRARPPLNARDFPRAAMLDERPPLPANAFHEPSFAIAALVHAHGSEPSRSRHGSHGVSPSWTEVPLPVRPFLVERRRAETDLDPFTVPSVPTRAAAMLRGIRPPRPSPGEHVARSRQQRAARLGSLWRGRARMGFLPSTLPRARKARTCRPVGLFANIRGVRRAGVKVCDTARNRLPLPGML
jgi:hypothetical protein